MTAYEEHEVTYGENQEKKIFYLAAGPKNGPLIIFVHGWPAIAQTWKPQMDSFASLGFRVVAPDMPGYGRSTARKQTEDYSLANINIGMVAVLEHTGRDAAIWVGHDWGCGAVWSFAQHYPSKTLAAAGLAVPAHTIERGLPYVLATINRDTYPEESHPYGQWDYMRYYEQSFGAATAWFDANPRAFLRAIYVRGKPEALSQRALTANVVREGGWFGGREAPEEEWKDIPSAAMCVDEETFEALVQAMERNGFWAADAWYANHARNQEYFERAAVDGGVLQMPTLFVGARYDTICDAYTSGLAEAQRRFCTRLTEASVEAGHWLALEKPEEVNSVIARWIVEAVPQHWPGYWSRGFVKSKV